MRKIFNDYLPEINQYDFLTKMAETGGLPHLINSLSVLSWPDLLDKAEHISDRDFIKEHAQKRAKAKMAAEIAAKKEASKPSRKGKFQ